LAGVPYPRTPAVSSFVDAGSFCFPFFYPSFSPVSMSLSLYRSRLKLWDITDLWSDMTILQDRWAIPFS
jgi:hypothetical protein